MFFNRKQIGNIIVKVDRYRYAPCPFRNLKQIVIGLVIVVLLGIGCVLVLSSLITKPIKELATRRRRAQARHPAET